MSVEGDEDSFDASSSYVYGFLLSFFFLSFFASLCSLSCLSLFVDEWDPDLLELAR